MITLLSCSPCGVAFLIHEYIYLMLILDDDDDYNDYDDALVCRRQVALGGYRLKHTLEEVLHTHTHTLSLSFSFYFTYYTYQRDCIA